MKRILFAFAASSLLLAATAKIARAEDVRVDFFYNNLSGGDWIEVGDYGYCWQPSVAVSNTSWRPYSDGYWAYTDLGWTWVSYEDFGWATYHYGRWSRVTDYGWVWVPGRNADLEWGPAWVSWRTGGEYIGWAPLPPESVGVVYEGRGISGRVDVDFDIGPSYYNFVDVRYIGEPVLRERIVDVNQNVTYINQTVNVTNITYKNKVVYNYGPDINVINQRATRPIQRLKIERQENVDASVAMKSGSLLKPQGDKLVVAAPMHIRKAEGEARPQAVKTRIEKAKIDKGWASVDPNTQTQLKQKFKTEDAKSGQIGAGAGANATAATGSSPAPSASVTGSAAAGTSPMPMEKDKGRHGNRPVEKAETNTAAGAGTSTAVGTSNMDGGQHRGKHEDKMPSTSPVGGTNTGSVSPAGATSGSETRDGSKHRGERAIGQPEGAQGDMSQGGQGGSGKPRGDRAVVAPEGAGAAAQAPSPGQQGQGQGQGKHEGGKKNKGEPVGSPGPSPQ